MFLLTGCAIKLPEIAPTILSLPDESLLSELLLVRDGLVKSELKMVDFGGLRIKSPAVVTIEDTTASSCRTFGIFCNDNPTRFFARFTAGFFSMLVVVDFGRFIASTVT